MQTHKFVITGAARQHTVLSSTWLIAAARLTAVQWRSVRPVRALKLAAERLPAAETDAVSDTWKTSSDSTKLGRLLNTATPLVLTGIKFVAPTSVETKAHRTPPSSADLNDAITRSGWSSTGAA